MKTKKCPSWDSKGNVTKKNSNAVKNEVKQFNNKVAYPITQIYQVNKNPLKIIQIEKN